MMKGEEKMKKEYVSPKAEMLDFDYTEIVVAASGSSGRTDESTTQWYTCNWRYVDVVNADRTVCGPVPEDLL